MSRSSAASTRSPWRSSRGDDALGGAAAHLLRLQIARRRAADRLGHDLDVVGRNDEAGTLGLERDTTSAAADLDDAPRTAKRPRASEEPDARLLALLRRFGVRRKLDIRLGASARGLAAEVVERGSARAAPAAGEVALAGHLAAQIGDLTLGARDELVRGPAGVGKELRRLAARPSDAGASQIALVGRRGPFGLCRLERGDLCLLGRRDRGQRLLHRGMLGRDALARISQDRRWQAETLGDGERLALAGKADRQAERRAQRGHVELDRGVADAGMLSGKRLQLGVVGGGGHHRAGVEQPAEDGHREG